MFTFIDLFSGIGGFRIALESLGGKCVGSSEIASPAIKVYHDNWSDNDNFGDITKIDSLPAHDIMVGGVPCQSWSIAGKMKGFEDPRGQLWGDVIRLLNKNQPKAFIFENVKGLADPRNTVEREFLIEQMNLSGYDVRYKLLNAYDYGVPQNRERIFIVGAKDLSGFEWPQACRSQTMLLDYMDNLEHLRTFAVRNSDPDMNQATTGNRLTVSSERNEFFIFNDVRDGETVIHSWDLASVSDLERQICVALLKNRRSKKYGDKDGNPMSYSDIVSIVPGANEEALHQLQKAGILVKMNEKYDFKNRRQLSGINGVYRIFLPNARFFSTLTASGTPDLVATKLISAETDEEYRREFIENIYMAGAYRQPTSREYARIQGFPDSHKLHSTASANIKLIGNAVPPPLVKQVAQQLVKVLK